MADTKATEVGESGPASTSDATPATFIGSGEYSVDEKGRLTLPGHMRAPFRDGGVLKVFEQCVVLWPRHIYDDAVDLLHGQVDAGRLELRQVRMFLTSSHPVSTDSQGRIVIPAKVRDESGLAKDVFIAGAGRRVELWPQGRYEVEMLLEQDDSVANALDAANY